ncbi:hypothetical protein ALMP_58830 [Streptomyces sp. A012304]|nr:hypothetical protein ALMP_58830 [Streptomyces sp. A012304]
MGPAPATVPPTGAGPTGPPDRGERPTRPLPLLTRHARVATVMTDFERRLREESRSTPYPAQQLERAAR